MGGEACLFHGYTLALPEFEEEGSVFVDYFFVGGINDCGLGDVAERKFGSHRIDVFRVADKDYVGKILREDAVGRRKGSRFSTLREHDALARRLGVGCEFVKKFHNSNMIFVVRDWRCKV